MATKTLSQVLNKIISILKAKISKADYYLAMCERVYTPSDYKCVSSFPGVTITNNSLRLSGNLLFLYLNVTMTSTAQTQLGIGNVTNNCIATFTINDFYGTDDTDLFNPYDNSDRIKYVAASYNRIDGLSGYSSGTASVATFDIQSSTSGGTVTIKVYTAAIQAKTSNFRIKALIPVRRMRWNPDGGTV